MRDPLIPASGRPPGWRDRLLTLFRRRNWRGFIRLYDLLKPIPGRRSLRVVTRYGSQFFLTPWDSVDSHVIAEGFYESEVLEAVRPALVPGAVLWVVGANFGLHAITAKMLHSEVTVVAFEPSPTMAARLLENCELNAVIIDLHVFALADRGGAWPFFANASGNPGMSTLHPVAQFPYDHRFTVATLTAADVLQRGLAPAPTVLILDVEGAETEVLNGFGATLGDRRLVRVIFEAENELLAASVEPPILRLLRAGGFSRFERLARHEHTAHTLSNFLALR